MGVSPSGPRGPTVPFSRGTQLLAAYLRFRYVEGFVRLYDHLRELPRQESRMTWAAMAGTTLLVITTPLLATLSPRLAAIPFEDTQGTIQSVPAAALILACLAFSLAWGYLLGGAAQAPGLLWLVVSLEYVYLVVQLGFVLGRSYLYLMPLFLPAVIGALTREGRTWAKVIFLVIVASLALRLTPLAASLGTAWFILWLPAGALLFAVHQFLARRPWAASRRVILASVGTLAYLLAIVLLGQPGRLAEGLNLSLNSAIGLLDLLWFLLGATFIGGAVALGRFARKAVEAVAPERVSSPLLLAAWAALALWAIRLPPGQEGFPTHLWAAAGLGALLAALGFRWRRHGVTREWLAGWLVVSVAAVVVLSTYATLDVGDLLTREAGVLSLAGFVYAITWEVASRVRRVPLVAAGFAQPSPLLLYLGTVLLIGAASLFGLTASLYFFQRAVIVQEYKGATSLWIPIALFTAAGAWSAFPPTARGRAVQAFVLGAVLAIPAFLARASAPDAVDLAALAAVVMLPAVLLRLWPEIRGHVPSAAVGVAVALGFAVSLSQRVLVDTLPPLLVMAGALSGWRAPMEAAQTVFQWSSTAAWRPADQFFYYAAAPILAAVVALAVEQRRRKTSS